ncbi:MAG: DUF4352 domain-containing protein [Chloroflexota bacterium]|nr:DUF4352 domain-containing protein [Chloroflexota bacterium]
MNNSELNQPASSEPVGPQGGAGGTSVGPQIFCPNCHGGNPPNAANCMWCGQPMSSVGAPANQPMNQGYAPQQPPIQQGYNPQQPPMQQGYPAQQPPIQQGYPPQQQQYGQSFSPQYSPMPMPARKSGVPVWLWVLFGLIGLCIVAGVAFAFVIGRAASALPGALQNAESTIQAGTNFGGVSDGTPETASLAVGNSGISDALKFTLNSIHRDSGDFLKPAAGNEYIVLNMTIENTSSDKKIVSTLLNFSVKDGTGHRYSLALGAKTTGSLDGDIAPNTKTTGETAFEVPANATGLVFIYNPLLGGDPIKFKLDK